MPEEEDYCVERLILRRRRDLPFYGQMGKKPKLVKCMINSVILDSVHYFSGLPGFLAVNMNLETA